MNQIVIAIAAVVAASGPAAAQTQKPVTTVAPAPAPVTRAQFLGQLNSGFAAMDTNHDGSLASPRLGRRSSVTSRRRRPPRGRS